MLVLALAVVVAIEVKKSLILLLSELCLLGQKSLGAAIILRL